MNLEYPREMFARLIREQKLTPKSDTAALFAVVDAIFFASLMIEEGEPVRVAVVHTREGSAGLAKVLDESPEYEQEPPPAWDVTRIAPRRLEAATLAKLARGLEYGTQLVVIKGSGTDLSIDGIARRLRHSSGGHVIRIAAPRPGVLVFERRFDELLRFEAGQQVTPAVDVIGSDGPVRRALGGILGEEVDTTRGATRIGGVGFYSYPEMALYRLIREMRATASGAILAMAPTRPRPNVLESVKYGRTDPRQLADWIKDHKDKSWKSISARIATHDENLKSKQVKARDAAYAAAELAEDALEAAIDDLAKLSAIDGAVLAGPRFSIYGAGYVIPQVSLPNGTVRRAIDAAGTVTEPYEARHGARHGAGISFAYKYRGAVVFIVSEDGPVKCALRVGEHVYLWSVQVMET